MFAQPEAGVNVYCVVVELLIGGDHAPEIPSNDDGGRVKEPPGQIPEIWLKVGVCEAGWALIVTLAVLVQEPFDAVIVYVPGDAVTEPELNEIPVGGEDE